MFGKHPRCRSARFGCKSMIGTQTESAMHPPLIVRTHYNAAHISHSSRDVCVDYILPQAETCSAESTLQIVFHSQCSRKVCERERCEDGGGGRRRSKSLHRTCCVICNNCRGGLRLCKCALVFQGGVRCFHLCCVFFSPAPYKIDIMGQYGRMCDAMRRMQVCVSRAA